MKVYQSFDEIDRELRKLSLERQIAYEELKSVKNDFEESIKPMSMIGGLLKFFSKYGALMLVKRFFK